MKAKDLELRPISARLANDTIRRLHYSGSVVRNSQVHIGAFWHGRLSGAIQLGPPLDRNKMLGLVTGTRRDNMAELNRLAFDESLPRNSESRALAVLRRLLQKHVPALKWLVTFADATRCGDGTIYRAAGLTLTGIKRNNNLARLPTGKVIHKMTLESGPTRPLPWLSGRSYYDVTGGAYNWATFLDRVGGDIVPGFQLRYMMFIDPVWKQRLTVPEIPYSEIERRGAAMYRGLRVGSIDSDAPAVPGGIEGGAIPTPTLQIEMGD